MGAGGGLYNVGLLNPMRLKLWLRAILSLRKKHEYKEIEVCSFTWSYCVYIYLYCVYICVRYVLATPPIVRRFTISNALRIYWHCECFYWLRDELKSSRILRIDSNPFDPVVPPCQMDCPLQLHVYRGGFGFGKACTRAHSFINIPQHQLGTWYCGKPY